MFLGSPSHWSSWNRISLNINLASPDTSMPLWLNAQKGAYRDKVLTPWPNDSLPLYTKGTFCKRLSLSFHSFLTMEQFLSSCMEFSKTTTNQNGFDTLDFHWKSLGLSCKACADVYIPNTAHIVWHPTALFLKVSDSTLGLRFSGMLAENHCHSPCYKTCWGEEDKYCLHAAIK